MRTTHDVFKEVSAGRMSPEEGLLAIEESQARDAATTRRQIWWGWVAVAALGTVLLIASCAWSAL